MVLLFWLTSGVIVCCLATRGSSHGYTRFKLQPVTRCLCCDLLFDVTLNCTCAENSNTPETFELRHLCSGSLATFMGKCWHVASHQEKKDLLHLATAIFCMSLPLETSPTSSYLMYLKVESKIKTR